MVVSTKPPSSRIIPSWTITAFTLSFLLGIGFTAVGVLGATYHIAIGIVWFAISIYYWYRISRPGTQY